MGIVERILCKVLPYTDILRYDTQELYLRRWFIYPRDKDFGKSNGKGRLYLHKFYRGDEDHHLHSHPWKFTSLILTRGYWEETLLSDMMETAPVSDFHKYKGNISSDGEERVRRFYPRFSILHRPATWKHRVVLADSKPVWTLVKTGAKECSWWFWIKGRMCPWRFYGNGNCLVETVPPPTNNQTTTTQGG